MTLTVCLKGADGIVVASDSRGTFGDPRGVTAQNDTIKKVHLIGNIAVLMAGAEQGNLIIEEAAKQAEVHKITDVTPIMEKVKEVAINKFDEWYKDFPFFPIPQQNPAFSRPSISLTVAGYDKAGRDGKPEARLYSMVSNQNYAPNLHDFGFALSGVVQYALYLLNRLYSPDLQVVNLKHLAAYVITETAAQDGKVGGPLQIGIISPTAPALMLTTEHITKIISENENKSKELKNLFKNIK